MAKVKRVLGIIIILALLIGSSAPFLVSRSPVAAQGDEFESFSPELAEQLGEIYQQKQALTPVQRKIDWSILQVIREAEERVLAALSGETPKFRELSTPLLKTDDAGNIEVKLTVTSLTAEQLEQLEDLGMNIRLTLSKYGIIEGSLPYSQVEAVAGLDFVVNVGTPGYAVPNAGVVTSAGDTVLRAAEARTAFDVDGSGIKVGVISDGVSNLADSVATGDLPSSPAVDVLQAGSGDEGTAILEIVHDLAPGAPLAFYGPTTSSDMVLGISALEAAGCDIIVDDLTFFDEPKFEDGPIALEARQFVTGDGVYVTSAGNNAQRHYMGTYVRMAGPFGDYPYAHDYGGGDVENNFTVPNGQEIVTILQWNNQWGLSGDDFDLALIRQSDDFLLTGSSNTQDGNDDPWEGFAWTNNTGSSAAVFILILEDSLVNPPSSLILDYNVYYGSGLQYVTTGNSVIGHSAVEEVLSVAAANAATPNTIESFSSRGPGTIYFPTYEERQVLNITGVDGVQTKTGQLGHFSNPFYGTSAAAPHVAAIAALVWEANPTLTSGQVRNAITSTAVDLGPAGYDYTWGFGRVDAYEAVASVVAAAAPPTVTSVTPDSGYQGQTLDVSITGTNFTGATAVSFGAGITINSFSVVTDTLIAVSITIAGTAALGPRGVLVTTSGGVGALAGGFTATAPAVTSPFSGTVTIDAVAAPTGTVIDVYVDGDLQATTTTTAVGWYEVVVFGTAADVGQPVTFTVNGLPAFTTPPTPLFASYSPQTVGLAAVSGANHTLTVTVSPVVGGSVAVDPDLAAYPENTSVTLTATAAPGWEFSSWSGDASGTSPVTTVTMTRNKSVTANFTEATYGYVETWNCPLGGVTLIAPYPIHGRPFLTVAVNPAEITVSAGAALWGIYYLDETTGEWLYFIPGFTTSTLTQLEPEEFYLVVVSAPSTLTIPQ